MSLYDVLNVRSDCSKEDIKRSFREKAKLSHPDKGGDKDTFGKQLDAYQTLYDASRRAIYDKELELKKDDIHPEVKDETNINAEILKEFFKCMFNEYSKHITTKVVNKKKKNILCEETISVTLEEIYTCKKKAFVLKMPTICTECQGQGGTQFPCGICFGKCCEYCDFLGYILHPKCWRCGGHQYTVKTKDGFVISLDPEIKFSQPIEVVEQSCGNNNDDNIIVIHLKEEKHPIYTREGNNITMRLKITLTQALGKFKYVLKHLDGKNYNLQYKNVISPGEKLLVKNLGLPIRRGAPVGNGIHIYNNNMPRGNLVIEFEVVFPTEIDNDKLIFHTQQSDVQFLENDTILTLEKIS